MKLVGSEACNMFGIICWIFLASWCIRTVHENLTGLHVQIQFTSHMVQLYAWPWRESMRWWTARRWGTRWRRTRRGPHGEAVVPEWSIFSAQRLSTCSTSVIGR
jgi:hypothetical protein